MANTYTRGQAVELTAEFNEDPDTVTCIVKAPSGTSTTYTYAAGSVMRTGAGLYSVTVVPEESGRWYHYWRGTGACAAADEDYFLIEVSHVI
jgi:hypothetical protein